MLTEATWLRQAAFLLIGLLSVAALVRERGVVAAGAGIFRNQPGGPPRVAR